MAREELPTMKSLLAGLRRYEQKVKPRYAQQFATLADGQAPHTLLITCADSRVVPNLIASADPGELFVVRNVANLVPPPDDEAAPAVGGAIAYAVDVLGVQNIVVCGHSGCGGMKAALADEPPPNTHLQRWLGHVRPSVELLRTRGPLDASRPEHDQLGQLCTLRQLGNLEMHESVRSRLSARANLRIFAFWFDISAATLLAYSPVRGGYVPATEELARIETFPPSRPISAAQLSARSA